MKDESQARIDAQIEKAIAQERERTLLWVIEINAKDPYYLGKRIEDELKALRARK